MEIVLKEAKKVLWGIFILDVIILIVSLFIGEFDTEMAFGVLFGSIIAYANFVVMGIVTAKAIAKHWIIAKKDCVISFILRYVAIFLLCGVLIYFKIVHPIGLLLPLLAPKLVYFTAGCFLKEE